jgi:trk system potassium uptake protein TrkA
MEKDEKKCEKLSVDLDRATILCGDGTDMNALDEENFKNTDALVALTDMDETNVIISLYAKEKKVDKVVTKINRNHVLEMVKTIGLDTIISPKEVIANHVIKFVRATELGKDEKINSLYRIHDKIEAIEFDVVDDGIFSDKTLKELKIRKDVLIGGIVRQGEYILPSGDCQLSVGDKVIVLAKANAVSDLADVLK